MEPEHYHDPPAAYVQVCIIYSYIVPLNILSTATLSCSRCVKYLLVAVPLQGR